MAIGLSSCIEIEKKLPEQVKKILKSYIFCLFNPNRIHWINQYFQNETLHDLQPAVVYIHKFGGIFQQ